jgi:hypothetical protein
LAGDRAQAVKVTVWVLSLGLFVASLAAAPAAAGGRPSGLKVTVHSVDNLTGEVDFDVTLYTDRRFPHFPPQGLLGEHIYTTFNGYTATLLHPWVPALDFGDGNVIAGLKLPQVAPGTYRGSFRHTYPGPGLYPLRAAAFTCIGLLAGDDCAPAGTPEGDPFALGEPILGSEVVFRAYTIWGWTTLTFTYQYPEAKTIGVANTPGPYQPFPRGAGQGLHIPEVSVLQIPTSSAWGLVLLALLLGASSLILLRR